MERLLPGQLILTGVPGPVLDRETAAAFREVQPGGFIIFSRNIRSPRQLRDLLDQLRDLSLVEPVITIDQEGGRVSRLRGIGQEPPNAVALREKGDAELITRHGQLTGELLRLFGFNLDLCPVLDISYDDEADNSLKGRTYGTSVAEVIEKAGLFNDALRQTGIASCGKHFPGYSSAGLDPHDELPCIDRDRATLDAEELAVFQHFCPTIDSMMIGHAHYPALDDSGMPSSLSRRIVHDLLRGAMGFEGLIMTDDLDMGAILNHLGFDETIRLAIEAGNEMAMICHRLEMVEHAAEIVQRMPAEIIEPAVARVLAFKKRLAPPAPFSIERFEEINAGIWDLRVAVLGEAEAAARSPENGRRSPVELY